MGGPYCGGAFLAVGLIPLWWLAGPCMFVAGLGFYMLHNTLQVQATQMAPERRGASVSLFAFCYFCGQAMGVGLAGYLLHSRATGSRARHRRRRGVPGRHVLRSAQEAPFGAAVTGTAEVFAPTIIRG